MHRYKAMKKSKTDYAMSLSSGEGYTAGGGTVVGGMSYAFGKCPLLHRCFGHVLCDLFK